jgi:hypothetical protein
MLLKAAVRQGRSYTRSVNAKLKEAAHLNVVYIQKSIKNQKSVKVKNSIPLTES